MTFQRTIALPAIRSEPPGVGPTDVLKEPLDVDGGKSYEIVVTVAPASQN